MNNPFAEIEARLSGIEDLLLDLKCQPRQVEHVEPIEQPEQFLNIREASELLKLTIPTMYSKVSKGELPVMKKGNRLYFSRIELLDYIKSGRKKSNAEIEQEANAYLSSKRKG